MISKEEIRQITHDSLQTELRKILNNYMVVYDEYHKTFSRDSAFIKDLVDSLIGISTVLEVYVRDGSIHSGYAIEKLKNSKLYIDAAIKYFKSKEEEE